MKRTLRREWPLSAAIVLLWMSLAVLFCLNLRSGHGHFTYTLDDSYTHMAIAKNLARNGVWGITRYEFAPASASPLWTLVLWSAFTVAGPNSFVPLLLNALFATLALGAASLFLRPFRLPPVLHGLLLLGVLFLPSLPALVFTGSEHVLHILLMLVFAHVALNVLSADSDQAPPYTLWILAAGLSVARYEGLFLVFAACLLFVGRRETVRAVALGLAALLPVGAFGAFFRIHGGYWLPNSVLLNSNVSPAGGVGGLVKLVGSTYAQILTSPDVLILIVAAIALCLQCRRGVERRWERGPLCLVLFLITAVLHIVLAFRSVTVTEFFRYESYLVVLGVLAVAVNVREILAQTARQSLRLRSLPRLFAVAAGLIGLSALAIAVIDLRYLSSVGWQQRYEAYLGLLGLPVFGAAFFVVAESAGMRARLMAASRVSLLAFLAFYTFLALDARGVRCLAWIPRATANTYDEQIQMGLFLHRYYSGATVAADDVGAINYLGDLHCVDLLGPGSMEVARKKRSGVFDREAISELTREHGARLAIVFDERLYNLIPQDWVKVGEWKLSGNGAADGEMVTFYATVPEEVVSLRRRLRLFAPHLPSRVRQIGLYTEQESPDAGDRGAIARSGPRVSAREPEYTPASPGAMSNRWDAENGEQSRTRI